MKYKSVVVSITLMLALSINNIEGCKLRKGGVDMFSFSLFMEDLFFNLENKLNLKPKNVIIVLDNASSHITDYSIKKLE